MRFVFTLLLISFSSVGFGQMTFIDIVKIYKMDMDQFEQYAISKGYDFDEFKRDENYNGMTFSKGKGKLTKYLTLYDVFYGKAHSVNFQTGNSSEVLSIKNDMKKMGYTLYKSFFMMDNITKVDKYRNNKFEMSFFTVPPNEKHDYAYYELSFGIY